MSDMQAVIERAWEDRDSIGPDSAGAVRDAVASAIAALDEGSVRIAEHGDAGWTVNQWLKMAVLLSFRLNPMALIGGAPAGAPLWGQVA